MMLMRLHFVIAVLIFFIDANVAAKGSTKTSIEEISDAKDFKKILRTKTNVLVCFTQSSKAISNFLKVFRQAGEEFRGFGTGVIVDCSNDGKKMCKKLKVNPNPYILKHYKDGDFHKDYDRKETVTAIVNFMKDPTGDLPWEEDSAAADIYHIADAAALGKLFRKEQKSTMVMFYAPWCGFCKRMKPDYIAAATELKGKSILAAIDVNKPENSGLRQQFNITGFPTLLYFEQGSLKHRYEGENSKDAIVAFMKNPTKPVEKPKDSDWVDEETEVIHLTTEMFDGFINEEPSVLVMFYAPWCGHCKRMKPEYISAAAKLATQGVSGRLAAVDATKEPLLATRFNIKGYPTVKYFRNGEYAFDANVRDEQTVLDFMHDPKEPPPPPPPETPWSQEDDSHVVHLEEETFKPFLKKKKHVLVMFYAPWCGHCKKAKPEFTSAAEHYKDDSKVEFAAVDCTAQQSLCSAYDVRGYPTIKYFHYLSKEVKHYQGGRTSPDFIAFMQNPQNPLSGVTPSVPPPTEEWKGLPGSQDLHHLTDGNFDDFMKEHHSVLVMFYAPWCGHCKKMKPDYALAAQTLSEQKIEGKLATVDATAEVALSNKYGIDGFPTIKYFSNGKVVSTYVLPRKTEDFVSFMKKPPVTASKDEL